METVSNICAVIVGVSMFITPVLFVIWAVKKLRKKPSKKMGIATLIGVVCFVVFLSLELLQTLPLTATTNTNLLRMKLLPVKKAAMKNTIVTCVAEIRPKS